MNSRIRKEEEEDKKEGEEGEKEEGEEEKKKEEEEEGDCSRFVMDCSSLYCFISSSNDCARSYVCFVVTWWLWIKSFSLKIYIFVNVDRLSY